MYYSIHNYSTQTCENVLLMGKKHSTLDKHTSQSTIIKKVYEFLEVKVLIKYFFINNDVFVFVLAI